MKREAEEKDSPSFRMDSPERISAAVLTDNNHAEKKEKYEEEEEDHDDDRDNEDFEFSFVHIRPLPETSANPPFISSADDIFSDGKILPFYPCPSITAVTSPKEEEEEEEEEELKPISIPLRRLFIQEERERQEADSSFSSFSSSSSSNLDELDGIAPGTYCVWTPNKNIVNSKKKRSSSTRSTSSSSSSSSRSWRAMRGLFNAVGRSHSDGKHRFVFIPIRDDKSSSNNNYKGKSGKSTEVDMQQLPQGTTTTTTTYYVQEAGKAPARTNPSFKDLLANATRIHHPS